MGAKVEDPIDFCPESVEKTVDLRNRAREFLKSLISKVASMNEKEPKILVVSHGFTIRQLIKIFFKEYGCVSKVPGLGDPTELLVSKKFRATSLNTCWSRFVIELSGGNFDIIENIECQEF